LATALHDCRADHHAIGVLADDLGLFRRLDAETDATGRSVCRLMRLTASATADVRRWRRR
jgi:hypothetical protein